MARHSESGPTPARAMNAPAGIAIGRLRKAGRGWEAGVGVGVLGRASGSPLWWCGGHPRRQEARAPPHLPPTAGSQLRRLPGPAPALPCGTHCASVREPCSAARGSWTPSADSTRAHMAPLLASCIAKGRAGVCEVAAGCRGNRHVQQGRGWRSSQPATQDIGTHRKRTVSSSSLHPLTMYSAQRGSEKQVHRTTCGVETMANSCEQEAGVGPE